MRSHREIGAWICKSLSMTNCLWCVINICFTFHSGTNINFKHKSKWPEAASPASSSLMESWQLTVLAVTQSSSMSPPRWPAAWDAGWLVPLLAPRLGWKVKFSLLPLDGARQQPPDQLEQVHTSTSLTSRQSQLGNDLGMCGEHFSNN